MLQTPSHTPLWSNEVDDYDDNDDETSSAVQERDVSVRFSSIFLL